MGRSVTGTAGTNVGLRLQDSRAAGHQAGSADGEQFAISRCEGTSGDFKISNVNGGIEMKEVEGSGSVQTVNGPVKVTFARNPTRRTSFKSVNGTLDVSFRPGLNADVKMKTMNGGLFTDFPVTALPVAATQPERRNGKFVWQSNRMTGVRIGSGGPELSFETLNGDVLIKNREK